MRRRRAAVGVGLLSLALLTGCTSPVPGTPDGEVVRPSITPSREELPRHGQCTDGGLKAVPCTEPHEGEVVAIGQFTGLGDTYPSERDLRRSALPACRTALAAYLGSTDHDATRLHPQVLWVSRDGWARGDRWRLCTVVEISPDGQRKKRTAPLKSVLKAEGFAQVQLCAQGSPGVDEQLKIVTCDTQHKAEAVPGVLNLGAHTSPTPSKDQVDAKAKDHCAQAVTGYVGAERPDVFASWRAFGSQAWAEGHTTVVCYAEATRPFTGRLWGLGDKPLPS
ncbi:septum formation family protein [Actinosynnema sp. CA-248983]